MQPLKSLLSVENLESLASRSNFRYGQEMAEEGKIEAEKTNTFNIKAKIQFRNSEKRTVELSSTTKGLRWKCTCTGRKDLFCEHCVAVGLNLIKE